MDVIQFVFSKIRSFERPLRPGDEAHRRLRDVDGGEVVVLVVRGLEAHRPDALRADELDVPSRGTYGAR